jgi:hypothetical protein
MGVVIETCAKYPGGPTRIRGTDIYIVVMCLRAPRSLFNNRYPWLYCIIYIYIYTYIYIYMRTCIYIYIYIYI